jgi:hypothetical protein
MSRNFTLLFFFLSLFSAKTYSQSSPLPKETAKTQKLVFEKVYLQLDRSYYSSGEDIWMKAYLTDALTNRLADYSNCLYVELVTSTAKIIRRQVVNLDKGTGNTDFHLNDSLPSGKYQVRAYTNWMRNFGEYFFFTKEIQVENMILKNTKPNTTSSKTIGAAIDVRLLPEGGSLVDDVLSLVAVKATDASGKGSEVKGYVISSTGDTVSKFETSNLGMGSFNFIPKKGLQYHAEGMGTNGITFHAEVPSALPTGYVMKVSNADNNNLRIYLRTNAETMAQSPNQQLLVGGTSHGNMCVMAKAKIKNLFTAILLPKDQFPGGIAHLTLMDTLNKPYCERLFYIQPTNQARVSVVTDKKEYLPREKVSLQISVTDTANHPLPANLSLAVIDAGLVKSSDGSPSNITTYQMLESELRGRIEQPARYFDLSNPMRYKELDLLLLTQGWRDFVWKHLADTTIKITNFMERGLSVTGRLRRLLVDKPIPDYNISMVLMGGGKPYFNITKTDSAGRYAFDGLYFTGKQNVVISSSNKNHDSKGYLFLDSILGIPPKVSFSVTQQLNIIPKETSDYAKEASLRYNTLKKYQLSDTILLNEVIIKTQKEKEAQKDDGIIRIYGTPDNVFTISDEQGSYTDIFQFLQGRVAGMMITGVYPNISFSLRGSTGTPYFMIDGVPAQIDEIADLPIAVIDKIEIVKDNLSIFGMNGANGAIAVFLKKGSENAVKPVFHSINKKVTGFYQARVFYAPKYDIPTADPGKPDLRATIHWEPNIVTDDKGNATISFFNADKTTTIEALTEGIAGIGVPVSAKTSYVVK